MLAALALRSWWLARPVRTFDPAQSAGSTSELLATRSPLLATFIPLAPWLLLALFFYIPGVYLEWPSDPWDHLQRINEWQGLLTVGQHSSWYKSSYFIIYSWVGRSSAGRELFYLDFYYTSICMLLCWQYYRLARACGLSPSTSMMFVILQTMLFGNNVFSFYRYYGISSSIYAQLGALALTRSALEFARGEKRKPNARFQVPAVALPDGRPSTSDGDPFVSDLQIDRSNKDALNPGDTTAPDFPFIRGLFSILPPILCLLLLVAFNHQQGVGIASIGIAAIVVWRLIEWERSALWWLVGGALALNALFLGLHPRPPIIEIYRAQGWLNVWYGFNILNLGSYAGDRMLQIVGTIGLVNVAVALVLLRRNHVVGWLTIMPLLIVLFPGFSVLFSTATAERSPIGVITFQRMLFAVPQGLALVFFAINYLQRLPRNDIKPQDVAGIRFPAPLVQGWRTSGLFATVCLALAALFALPGKSPHFNHAWNALYKVPDDLSLRSVWSASAQQSIRPPHFALAATSALASVKTTQGLTDTVNYGRVGTLPANDLNMIVKIFTPNAPTERLILAIPDPTALTTPYSFAALSSTHWLPQETALAFSGANELHTLAERLDLKARSSSKEHYETFYSHKR